MLEKKKKLIVFLKQYRCSKCGSIAKHHARQHHFRSQSLCEANVTEFGQ